VGRRRTRALRFALALTVVGVLAGIVVATAAALRFTDDSCRANDPKGCKPPEGVVGSNYAHKLTGEGGNGEPFTYIVKAGALPPGLSLNPDSGLISGRATGAGTANFDVELQDNPKPEPDWCVFRKSCAVQPFSITILPGLSIETKTLPTGASVGVQYNAPLSAMMLTSESPRAGFVPATLTWSIASGTLPPGVTLTSGALTGTPTAEGTFSFVVKAEFDAKRVDTETLTMVVRTPLAIQAARPLAPAPAPTRWEVGVPFSAKLNATGGSGTYTWSLTAGTLPAGLAFGPDGTIAGRPRAAGSFPFTVGLTDSEGRTASYQTTLSIAAKLSVATVQLRSAKVGRLYRFKLKSAGGVLPVKWKIKSGTLPRGVRFASALGMFTGTPRKAGTYRVVVEATDALKVKSQKRLTLTVLP
jgi:hypothetical protein